MTTPRIEPPLGGVSDTCGICGRTLYSADPSTDAGYVALNGVICEQCTININHFSPIWYCIEPAHHPEVQLFEYSGYPGTPFWDGSVGGIFADVEFANDPGALSDFYKRLPHEVKELIHTVPLGELSTEWTTLTPDWADDHPIIKEYGWTDSEDHPYTKLKSVLPRPYAISGNTIIAREDDLPPYIDPLLAESDSEDDAGQKKLAQCANDNTTTTTDTNDSTSDSAAERTSTPDSTDQAGLEAFS